MKSAEVAPAGASHQVLLDDLEVNLQLRTVTRDGCRLPVEGRSFQLLQCLIEKYPDTAAHRDLLDTVWKGLVVTPDVLSQRVRLLRKALEDTKGDLGYIVSVHGQGYRLSEPPRPMESAAPVPAARFQFNGKVAWIVLAVAALPLLAILAGEDPHAIKHFFKHLFN